MDGVTILLLIFYGIIVFLQSQRIAAMPEDTPEQQKAKKLAWEEFHNYDD